MAEFYVNRDALSDGTRPLHRSGCGQLPAIDTLVYLGSYGNSQAAYTKANNKLAGVIFCPQCLAETATS